MGKYESGLVTFERVEREFSVRERMRALGHFTASDREKISITFLIMYNFAREVKTCALL